MAELVEVENKIDLVTDDQDQSTDPIPQIEPHEPNCKPEGGRPGKVFLTAFKRIEFGDVKVDFGDHIDLTTDTGRLEKVFYETIINHVTASIMPKPPVNEIPVTLEVGSSMFLANVNDRFINRSNNKPLETVWYLHHSSKINAYLIYSHDRKYHWVFDPSSSTKTIHLQQAFAGLVEDTNNWFLIDNTGAISPFVERSLQIIDIKRSTNAKFHALQATTLTSQDASSTIVRVTGN